MRRNLQLKREALTALDTEELARVAGGSIFHPSDVTVQKTVVCATDTCLTTTCR